MILYMDLMDSSSDSSFKTGKNFVFFDDTKFELVGEIKQIKYSK